ncbi:hypothetical protein ACFE04_003336 [Oxalis oulophora]
MKTLTSLNSLNNPQITPPFFLFHFPSLSHQTLKFLNYPPPNHKSLHNPPKLPQFKLNCVAPSSYAGWDDNYSDSVNSTESDHLRSFLISIGFNDKRYVFVFLLGFISALSISRVKVSSLVVFPACALVFAVGFSIGCFRHGISKNSFFKVNNDSGLRVLFEFFERLENTLGNLKKDIESACGSNKVTVSNLKGYVDVIESISKLALTTRNVVEASMDDSNGLVVESQKSSKKKKGGGFDMMGLFGEKKVDLKASKVKDNVKQVVVENSGNDQVQGIPLVEEKVNSPVYEVKADLNSNYSRESSRRMRIEMDDEEMSFREMENSDMRKYRQSYSSMNVDSKSKTRKSDNNLLDSMDDSRSISFKHMETESSFVQEQMFSKGNGAYSSSRRTENSRNETYSTRFGDERVKSENDFGLSNDVLFDKYLSEANSLLIQAKECIRNRKDEEHAEVVLYKSAKILSQAVEMKPMSLMAVGQLGNTYLLHGELKLKFSRQLRDVLRGGDPLYGEQKGFALRDFEDKDKVASVLVDVCEECEKLLVEAGRKYRLALSIDGNDVRALYNWGLALSFRAQLIADIGPEAAFDADKIFLAAIDKFDAMMSKGNVHTPDALFRWGVALQQRSYLRPSNSKEKVKLLQQARRLYEDAIDMEPNNRQAKEALLSCVSELNYRRF